MAGAADDARREAEELDRRVLAAVCAADGNGIMPAALAFALKLDGQDRLLRRSLKRLEERGHVRRDASFRVFAVDREEATVETAAHAVPGTPERTSGLTVTLDPDLDRALSVLPSAPHMAFIQLLAACIVSRCHLWRRLTTGWPHFAAFGEPRSGKTFCGYVVCAVFGIPTDETPGDVSAIHNTLRETAKSLFGRRVRRGGKLVVQPAREVALPYLLLDEVDRPVGAFLNELLAVLDGGTIARLEGCEVRVRYTPMVAWNVATGAPPPSFYQPAHQARAVALDTRTVGLTDDTLGPAVADLLAPGALPRFRLADLHPRAEVADTAYPVIAPLLRRWLTRRGSSLTDARFLARIVPGWAVLSGQRAEVAARNVALAYLIVSGTLGGFVKSGYLEAVQSEMAGAPAPSRAPAAVANDDGEFETVEEEEAGAGFDFRDLCASYREGYAIAADRAFHRGYFACQGGARRPRPDDWRKPEPAHIAAAVCHVLTLPSRLATAGVYDTRAVSKLFKAGEQEGQRVGYALGWWAQEHEYRVAASLYAPHLKQPSRDSLRAGVGTGRPEDSFDYRLIAGLPRLALPAQPTPPAENRPVRASHDLRRAAQR